MERQAIATDKAVKGLGSDLDDVGSDKQIKNMTRAEKSMRNIRRAVSDTGTSARGVGQDLDRLTPRFATLHSWATRVHDVFARLSGTGNTGFFTRMRRDFRDLMIAMKPMEGIFKGVAGGIGGVIGGVKGLVTAFPPMISLALVATPVVLALGAAILALGASLGAAVGGALVVGGGLLGAFVVGLGSIAAVAIPAISSLTKLRTAQDQLNMAIAEGAPQSTIDRYRKQIQMIEKQYPGLKQVSGAIKELGTEWRKLSRPAQKEFFALLADGIHTVEKLLPQLANQAQKNLGAVKRAWDNIIGPGLRSKAFQQFIGDLGKIFRANLPGFARGLVSLGDAIHNMIHTALPQLEKVGGGFAKIMRSFDKFTASPKGQRWTMQMISAFKSWGSLLGNAIKLLGTTFLQAGQGTKVIQGWADSLAKFADYLSSGKGQKAMKDFFSGGLGEAGKLVKVLQNLVGILRQFLPLLAGIGKAIQDTLGNLPPDVAVRLGEAYVLGKAGRGAIRGARKASGTVDKGFKNLPGGLGRAAERMTRPKIPGSDLPAAGGREGLSSPADTLRTMGIPVAAAGAAGATAAAAKGRGSLGTAIRSLLHLGHKASPTTHVVEGAGKLGLDHPAMEPLKEPTGIGGKLGLAFLAYNLLSGANAPGNTASNIGLSAAGTFDPTGLPGLGAMGVNFLGKQLGLDINIPVLPSATEEIAKATEGANALGGPGGSLGQGTGMHHIGDIPIGGALNSLIFGKPSNPNVDPLQSKHRLLGQRRVPKSVAGAFRGGQNSPFALAPAATGPTLKSLASSGKGQVSWVSQFTRDVKQLNSAISGTPKQGGLGEVVKGIGKTLGGLVGGVGGKGGIVKTVLGGLQGLFGNKKGAPQDLAGVMGKAISGVFDTLTGNMTKSSKQGHDNVLGWMTNLTKGMGNQTTAMQQGTSKGINTLFGEMNSALQKLGVSNNTTANTPSPGGRSGSGNATGSRGGRGGNAQKAAMGRRVPGQGLHDTVPVGHDTIAAPGELIVNRHTEQRIDNVLNTFGTSLGGEVDRESRPHYMATGGRATGAPTARPPGRTPMERRGYAAYAAYRRKNPHHRAHGGRVGSGGTTASVYPLPIDVNGRTDMGVDFAGTGPVVAMGDAKVLSTHNYFAGFGAPDWGLVYQLMGGAPSGISPSSDTIYHYEGIHPHVHVGQMVRAGQTVGSLVPPPASSEIGFSVSGGEPALAAPHYTEGKVTAEGEAMRKLLSRLRRGGALAGGGGGAGAGGMVAPHLKVPVGAGGGMFGDVSNAAIAQVAKAAQDKVNKAAGGAARPGGGGAAKVSNLPQSLQKYNYRWAKHWSPDFGGPTMPVNKIEELAEWAGMPGVTMAQVAHGESGYRPGAGGTDPGGTKGYGLWAITSPFHPEVSKYGGYEAMLNPVLNAMVAAGEYKSSGLSGWYGTRYLTGDGQHYHGTMAATGSRIPWYGAGADFIAHRPSLIGVGDGGAERVTVSPTNKPGRGGGVTIGQMHIHNNRPGDVRQQVKQEIKQAFDDLGREMELAPEVDNGAVM